MLFGTCLNIHLLWLSIVLFMFGRQLYDSFIVFLLKIFLSACPSGKQLLTIEKNVLPMFVFTLRSNGGLYQVIFRDLFYIRV